MSLVSPSLTKHGGLGLKPQSRTMKESASRMRITTPLSPSKMPWERFVPFLSVCLLTCLPVYISSNCPFFSSRFFTLDLFIQWVGKIIFFAFYFMLYCALIQKNYITFTNFVDNIPSCFYSYLVGSLISISQRIFLFVIIAIFHLFADGLFNWLAVSSYLNFNFGIFLLRISLCNVSFTIMGNW